jgi:hypothetical protein
MRYGPPFSFARRRDGRRLAYQVVGQGGLDLVFLFGWPTHLFDRLGDGLSDRGPTGHTLDDEMDDVRTGLAAELGDRRWHRVLVDHQALVRGQLARFRGREVKTTGDGFLASFDGPARAIRAAAAIRAGLRDHGLQVRAGLHTGECELLGGDIGGIAVHIAARVLGLAGAGFAFADRGTHRLKGVLDSWQLYAVEPAAA